MRAGDREREDAVASLRRHYVSGRLTLSEFSDRVQFVLQARSRADVGVALRDLPLVWEDAPIGLRTGVRSVIRGGRRLALLLAIVWLWSAMSLVLVVALVVALVVGDSSTLVLLVFPLIWGLATYRLWRVWRNGAARA
jgi:hypothetical protein